MSAAPTSRSSVATVVVQLIELCAQLGAGVLIGHLLGPDALGVYTLAMSLVSVAAVVLQPGTADVVLQLALEGEDPRALLGAGLQSFAWGLVRVAGVLAVGAALVGVDGHAGAALALATSTLTLNGLAALLGSFVVARGLSTRDVPGMFVARAALVALVAAGGLLGSLPLAMSGGVVGGALLIVWRLVILRRGGVALWPPRRDARILERLRASARRLGVGVVAGSVAARADIFVLRREAAAIELGLYGAAYRLIAGGLVLAQAIALALHPALSRALAAGDKRAVRRYFAVPAVLGAALLGASAAGVSRLLPVLFGAEFVDAEPLLDVLLAVGACQVANTFLARALLADNRGGALWPRQIVLAVVGPVLQLVCVRAAGAMGAACAALVTEGALLVMAVALWRVRTRL